MKQAAKRSTEHANGKNKHPNLASSPEKELRRRTGPKGKRAMVSDESVESIARDMEERTKLAIKKIGRSIGF